MQQDPSSSWNKPLLYRNKSAATTSTTTAATATTPTVSSTAAAAVVVAVATNSTATSTGSTSGSSALPPSIHSRSPASTPCLTSSHVRPNTNRHADVLAIHPSFDLSIPSSSDSGHSLSSPPSSPTSSSDHQDSINAIVAYQHEHETTLQNDTTSPSSQGKRSADWLPYNTTVTVSLRELRDLGTESRSSLDHDLESDNDVEMRQDAPTSKNNKSNDDNNRSSNNSTVKQIQDTLQNQDHIVETTQMRKPSITVDTSLDSSSSFTSRLPQSSHNSSTQSSSQRDPLRKAPIFLPHFFSSAHPPSLPDDSKSDLKEEDSDESSSETDSDSKSDHSIDATSPYIVVTDVKSISFRDISTVPTLTTFDRKPSKRRNSSASYPSPALSTIPSHSDPFSSSASRRKRVKKSSSSTKPACGCAKVHNSSTLGSDSVTELRCKKEHRASGRSRRTSKSRSGQAMGSTGRIRTLSESEASVSEPNQSSHRLLHQRQRRESREPSSIQDQNMEQSQSTVQDSISTTHDQIHVQHLSQSQRSLRHTQHSTQNRSKEYQLRIQIPQQREQHQKRQRSPPAHSLVFETSIDSSSTLVRTNSGERQKRARHQSSDTTDDGNAQQMTWQNTDQQREDGAKAKITLQIQAQQPPRIHPLDKDTISNVVVKNGNSRSPGKFANIEPSIHPLDMDVSQDGVKSQHGLPSKDVSLQHSMASKVHSNIATAPAPKPAVSIQPSISTPAQSSHRMNINDKTTAAPLAKATTTSSVPDQAISSTFPKPVPLLAVDCDPATLMLPITRETLRELDMLEIFKNPQLRHDIVFDPHLQFRPNFDGERGLVKRREADRFWREVGIELNNRRATLAARREASNTMLSLAGLPSSSSASRLVQQQAQQLCPLPKAVLLPRLIDELREILISLLPPTPPAPATSPDGKPDPPPINPERVQLMSTLDPDLIIQELDHGVLDVHALFRFLGDCLKGHCAPMRDALVESMVNIVVDFDEIVRGIRMCFEILEWMKLDIANHQLRTLRPWLLNNSVDFEQKYFADLLTRGGSFERTISWFKRAWIQWESVKRTVIGPQVTNNETSAQSNLDSRRSSLATSTTVTMIFDTDHGNTGQEPNTVSSSASTILDDKRRSAIIRADIGENILDGVVNEGLLEMILRPHRATKTMPETFEFDHYRLLSFHNDFQDLTILCILLILFRQLAQNAWTQQDLVEIKKVVWLLLTDENANFGANTNPGPGAPAAAATGDSDKSSPSASSSGMKDIVIQIEFAARKVRERNKSTTTPSTVTAGSGVARPSQSVGVPTLIGVQRRNSLSLGAVADAKNDKIASSTLSVPLSSLAMSSSLTPSPSASSSTLTSGLSGNDTNLLAAWLDNALTKTSMLYQLIQKRLLIHFRRWLYLHSCSSMMVLSASCATLASAMSMSKATGSRDTMKTVEEDEEDENGMDVGKSSSNDSVKDQENKNGDGDCQSAGAVVKNQSSEASSQSGTASTLTASTLEPASAQAPAPSQDAAPGMSAEEANKAAAEALAAKLSFNTVEMEAHGLTGLEDEMIALLEKIRAVAEFNKKVYGSWYRDLVMQGRAENWLEKDIRV